MLLTKLEKVIVLNLKGRISKILNVSSRLKKEERKELESTFEAIDKLLLYSGKDLLKAKKTFQQSLQRTVGILRNSTKEYVKEHIVPLMSKISTNEWGRTNE